MKGKYQEGADNTICKICKNRYEHLGSHLWHKHHIKSREYKRLFNLDYNYPLISEKVRVKKQVAFNKDREKYLKNLDTDKFRFKKRIQNRKYFSRQSLIKAVKTLEQENKSRKKETCPVCNLKYLHLDSHLFNKHKLLRAKQEEK